MYIILVYDVDISRVNKINKYLKKYLLWIQNSVFEGEISENLYKKMIEGLKNLINEKDSIVIYKFKAESYLEKEFLGVEKSHINNVI